MAKPTPQNFTEQMGRVWVSYELDTNLDLIWTTCEDRNPYIAEKKLKKIYDKMKEEFRTSLKNRITSHVILSKPWSHSSCEEVCVRF